MNVHYQRLATAATAALAFAQPALAGVKLGARGQLVYSEEARTNEAEYALPADLKDGRINTMKFQNVRGVLVLEASQVEGGIRWGAPIPIGMIDQATGDVLTFDGVTYEVVDGKLRFLGKGESYPRPNPSLERVNPDAPTLNGFRYALGSALVQQTLSDRYSDQRGAGSRFVREYLSWRQRVDESGRSSYDRLVLSLFARSNFNALATSYGPDVEGGLRLLELGLNSEVANMLTQGERVAMGRLLESIFDGRAVDGLVRMRQREIFESNRAIVDALRLALADVIDPAALAGLDPSCGMLERGFDK